MDKTVSRTVTNERENKKVAILKSAAKLFRKRSFAGTTVKDIAEDAGIQQGSLYYYISSKEDVLFEIINTILDKAISEFKHVLLLKLEPPQKLILSIKTHIGFVSEHQDEMAIAIETTEALSPERFKIVDNKRDLYVSIFEDIIKEGIEKGYFRKIRDPKIITFALLGMCNWVVKWFSPHGTLKPSEIADIFSDLFLYGLLKREKDNIEEKTISFVKKAKLELIFKELIEKIEKGNLDTVSKIKETMKIMEE